MWDEKMLKWQTPDGSTPPDRVQECGFLSGFALRNPLEQLCQLLETPFCPSSLTQINSVDLYVEEDKT